MSKRPRRNHTPAFKAKVALSAIKAMEHWLSLRSSSTCTPIRLTPWKAQLEEGAADVFSHGGGNGATQPAVST